MLAERSGVDAAKVREALLGGFAGSKILEVHGQRMLDRTFDPGFRAPAAPQGRADRDGRGRGRGVADPVVRARSTAQLQRAVDAGDGELDHSALFRELDREAGR